MSRFERERRDHRYHEYDRSRNYYQGKQNNTLVAADGKPIVKEKPNFKPSGLLAKESNNINGIALKYTTPKDSINPPKTPSYHIYSFKQGSQDPIIYDLVKSYYLIGRDEKVVDIETDDETCSKQHAVIQFREISTIDSNGNKTTMIKYVSFFIMHFILTNIDPI